MSDYNSLTDSLEQIKHELAAQVQNLEDPSFGDFLGTKNVSISIENAKILIEALQQAANAINILSMDSLQLDIQDERMNKIRSDFAELHGAHTLLCSKNGTHEQYESLKNVIATKIRDIKTNL